MTTTNLPVLAQRLLEQARAATSRRAADTVHGGRDHRLRQTVIALIAGARLHEHESPGEATLQVVEGRIRLTAGDLDTEAVTGDHLVIPPVRHAVDALEDSVVLLTVVVHPTR